MTATLKRYSRTHLSSAYCFDVYRDDILWPNGKRSSRELIEHAGISVMLPVLDKNHMILINQYRYGPQSFIWELPAGTVKKGEPPLRCAKRELEEEIGYRAKKWNRLTSSYVSPAFSTEVMHCFLARDLYATKSALEEYEILTAKVFHVKEIHKMIKKNVIRDAKTLVSLFHYFHDWN